MTAYWLMFAVPILLALWPIKGSVAVQRLGWMVVGLLFTLLIGFRFEVGGDWVAYMDMYESTVGATLLEATGINEPGYMAINWLSGLVGGGIYLVNLLCGLVVMAGIIAFARRQPLPWLALLVAVPYMIIVVAMGYSRQGVALGFEMLAFGRPDGWEDWAFRALGGLWCSVS